MKNLWREHREVFSFIVLIFCFWRLFLFIPQLLGNLFLSERTGFLGPIPWANFDGVHYLSIAEHGYFQYEQAFFPLFPLLLGTGTFLLGGNSIIAGLIVVHVSLLIALVFFYKLVLLDFSRSVAQWAVVFLLFFPTSFFLGSLYTESTFLCFIFMSLYFVRKNQFVLGGILGGFASLTRSVGFFLLPAMLFEYFLTGERHHMKKIWGLSLIPLGLLFYMGYLFVTVSDPLAFIHVQPAFGANRSGGEIILLPQVLYRYLRIFLTVPPSSYDFWIAGVEVGLFLFTLVLLLGFMRKLRLSYVVFGFLVLLTPTATGTLSSIPRYILAVFPLFIGLALIKQTKVKIVLLTLSMAILVLLSMVFLKGYFVA